MANKSKAKGTRFETACALYLSEQLECDVERRALHGAKDMGDLFGIKAHGSSGIAECKNYKAITDSELSRWKEQTVVERGNADADFALLLVHKPATNGSDPQAKTFGNNLCYVQLRDLAVIAGTIEGAQNVWVQLTLQDAARLMRGWEEDWTI